MQDSDLQLNGSVEGITFRNEDTSYTVLELDCDGELVTVVGILPPVSAGDALRAQGHWETHSAFGRQFKAELCERSAPTDAADMQKYLASGAVKGIGPVMAVRMVEAFGAQTFDVLENDPKRLAELKGISPAKALAISQEFKKQFAVREVMISLEKYGMKPQECLNAFRLFGAGAVDTIRRNPYILCEERIGIGFDRADSICANLPEPPDANLRIQAGILHTLRHNLGNGHTCLPRRKLIPVCSQFLGCTAQTAEAQIEQLLQIKRLVDYDIGGHSFLFLPHIYLAEQNIAKRLQMFLRFPPAGADTAEQDIQKLEKQSGMAYEEKQREAILCALRRGMLILTGGPGTGKTTTLKAILQLFEQAQLDVALAAPTGRAAKRMSEVTGKPSAKTIHRLLEVQWDQNENQTFARNEENPLDCDVLILDELSMVDIRLFSALLDAVPIGCRLVLVGDANQLPPVGAGNVLHDLIDSRLLPTVALTQVFRQALESLIVTNAHRIVQGEMPTLNSRDNDFFFLPQRNPHAAAQLVCDLCAERLPSAYGYAALTDIQVLSPSRRGECGTISLNRTLQAVLNPPERDKREIQAQGRTFRMGDKVMQIKNNYDLEWTSGEKEGSGIFNGDIGVLERISADHSTLEIHFDDKLTHYPAENLAELEHAYAVTVHKSQGSEFEAVVLPVIGVPPPLAYRNLLYTAVTRAKARLIALGSPEQLAAMVANDKETKRYSALKYFLAEERER